MAYQFYWNDQIGMYSFITDKGVSYGVSFLEDFTLDFDEDGLIENVYQIILEQIKSDQSNNKGFDDEIAHTIRDIVVKFFLSDRHKVLVYVCDNNDNKALGRSILFNKWFVQFNSLGLYKFDKVLDIDGRKIYTSLLVHKENAQFDVIVKRYQGIEQSFKPEE
ncbi:DUF6169 family protein [Myroides sp. C4067]